MTKHCLPRHMYLHLCKVNPEVAHLVPKDTLKTLSLQFGLVPPPKNKRAPLMGPPKPSKDF